MGFLSAPEPRIIEPTTGLAGLTARGTTTHVHREPVPWVAGRARLPLVWLGDAWGQRSIPIRVKQGKKKVTTGYRYYASAAGLLCAGPIDALLAIWIDGERAWEGPLSWSGNSADVTVEGRGLLRVYKGTWSQTLDGLLAASGRTHFAYRGLCYVVLWDWLLGDNRINFPNLELLVRRIPVVTQLTAPAAVGTGANPVHALADLLLDATHGPGLDPGLVDWPSWNAAAAWCASAGIQLDGALQSYTRIGEVVGQMLQTWGGRLYASNGLLALEPPDEVPADAPIIGPGDYTEPPVLEFHGVADVVGSITVRYRDEALDFQGAEVVVPLQDREGRAETLDAPWIARQDLAWRIAAGMARARGAPWLSGRMRVRRNLADRLRTGSCARMTAPHAGIADVPIRVTRVTIENPWAAAGQIEWEEDTAPARAPEYAPPADPPPGSYNPTPADLSDAALVEAEWGVYETDEPHLIILAARGDQRTDAVLVYQLTSQGWTFLTSIDEFAWLGTLLSPLGESGSAIITPGLDIQLTGADRSLPTPAVEEARQLRALALIDSEWFTWWSPSPIGADQYRIQARRGAFGSPRGAHAAGAKVWLLQLDQGAKPPAVRFKRFSGTLALSIKLQPTFAGHALPLENVPTRACILTGRARRPPEPIGVLVQGARNPTWSAGQPLTVAWRWASRLRPVRQDLTGLPAQADAALVSLVVAGQPKRADIGLSSPITIPASAVTTAVGAASTFELHVHQRLGGVLSDPAVITVHRV